VNKLALPLVAVVLLQGCAIVKSHMIRDDWAKEDNKKVRRLAVVVRPLGETGDKAGALFARVARRYVNMKRDFLVKQELVQKDPVKLEAVCGGDLHIEGVLMLDLTLAPKGQGFEAEVSGKLARCGDGVQDWTAEAAGSFPSKDEHLLEVTQNYVRELGPEVEPFVAPAMNLLRPALDTLPQPVLSDEDQSEKMGMED
jgi:probable lipoprotein (TIGR04455 family)